MSKLFYKGFMLQLNFEFPRYLGGFYGFTDKFPYIDRIVDCCKGNKCKHQLIGLTAKQRFFKLFGIQPISVKL